MAGPRKVSKEQYDEFRSKMEEKYGYDEMSDEEKNAISHRGKASRLFVKLLKEREKQHADQ